MHVIFEVSKLYFEMLIIHARALANLCDVHVCVCVCVCVRVTQFGQMSDMGFNI